MMVISNGQPASVTWDYDRVELVADGIVHAIGVSLGVVGAIVIVIVAANSARAADMPSIVIYTIGDPIVIPGDARRLAIRNDHHCFSNLKTRFTRIEIRPFNDRKYRVTGAVQTRPRECFDDPSTGGPLRVDTVEKVGCMLHALMVRRQYDCRTSSVKVKR